MPKVLRLISLQAFDLQDDDQILPKDQLRFIVVLDGHPAKRIGWEQKLGEIHEFTDDENLTDEEWAGQVTPFVFWSFADITVYDSDPEGASFGIEGDTDEWIQTVRLDHRSDNNPIMIGKESGLSFLAPGRSDCSYILTYRIVNWNIEYDEELFQRLAISHESEWLSEGEATGDFEFDKGDCKWICAIDGGGLRGIFALRMLEQREHYYNRSCLEMFDMFAGTSTGSLIAGGLASGRPLREIIALYCDNTTRRQIFRENSRGQHHAFRFFDLRRLAKSGQDHPNLDNARYFSQLGR